LNINTEIFINKKPFEYIMNKWLEILVGLVFLIAGILAWAYNLLGLGAAAWSFFKGGLMWFVLLIGFLFILLGISDLKE
jgi:hypothetical protein